MKNLKFEHFRRPRKILILGAGIGGLYCAYILGKNGYNVTLLESRSQDELGFPWCDAVDPDTFKDVGIDLPSDAYIPKQVLSFIGPQGEGQIRQKDNKAKSLDVDRKKLIKTLISLASAYSTIYFNTNADELLIEDNFVIGAKCGDKIYKAELTIDSTGVFSKYRESTPTHFLMRDEFKDEDVIHAYRTFIKKRDDEEKESNVYLMPHGIKGITWCKDAPDKNYSDVFIGKTESLTEKDINLELYSLYNMHTYLTDKHLFDIKECIPIRYPLGMMVGDGYVIVGNAAATIKPTSGSGIQTTLIAAYYLCKAIAKAEDRLYTAENLWDYQYDFMKKVGDGLYRQYIVRCFMEYLPTEDLQWIFTSGLLNENLINLMYGQFSKLNNFSFNDIKKTYGIAMSQPKLTDTVNTIIKKFAASTLITSRMPRSYEFSSVLKWKTDYDEFIKKVRQEAEKLVD